MRFLLALIFTAVAFAQAPKSKPKLIYVVILSRHGVRSPTATNDSLSRYAADPWQEWAVAPGELTRHGAKLLGILGGWYREWLAHDGLLPETGCKANVHVRADVGQRTQASARAMIDGMFPGCAVPVSTARGDSDPLFHPVASGLVHGDTAQASAALSGRAGGHPEAGAERMDHAFLTLRYILFGCDAEPGASCPAENRPGKQGLLSLPTSIAGTEDGLADIRGPVRTGSTIAENLFLEYADGKTGRDLGWGRLDESKLHEVMAIHTAYVDLARRTPYLASLQGSNLLSHVLRSIEQAVSSQSVNGALGKPGDRLLLLMGHDSNIAPLASLLNLSWLLPGYQHDDTPPGGSLVFRLWQGPGASYRVETLYIAQTPDQMHDGALLGPDLPPATANISVPGCAGASSGCDWQTFREVVSKAINSNYAGHN